MKKKKLLLPVILLIMGLNSAIAEQQYTKKITKDKNGYSYEYFENDPTKVRIYTLKNGLKVYLSKNEDKPEINTSIAIKAGSNNDPRNSTGLAHYFEHMMFKGTTKLGTSNWAKEKPLLDKIEELFEKRRGEKDPKKIEELYAQIDKLSYEASQYAIPGEYDKAVSILGAKGTNAYTSFDETVYTNTIPSNELERWLHLEKNRFSDIVLRVFHTELETVYEEYNRGEDNNNRRAFMKIIEESLEGTNYGVSVLGKPEHLKNPSIKDIYQFAKDYYVPNNMAIVLCGDLDYDNTIKLIDNKFKDLKPNKNLSKLKTETLKQVSNVAKIGGKKLEIVDPEIEKLFVTYKYKPNTKEEDLLSICALILSSKIGLINTNINNKQVLMGAGSYPIPFKYQAIYNFVGVPKKDQTLDDVEKILFDEIKKLQKGDFDDDIITATLNNLKIDEETKYESISNNNKMLTKSFINEIEWNVQLSKIDKLKKIKKEEVVAFAKEFFKKENALLTYKRKGEKKVLKVDKPKITPVKIVRDKKSQMILDLEKMKSGGDILPKEVDLSLIKTKKLDEVEWNFVENTRNSLFSLSMKIDLGYNHIKDLSLASEYFSLLGTDKKSLSEIKKEFYKLAISYGIRIGDEKTMIYLSGLNENLEEGIKLLDEYISNLKVDKKKYNEMVKNMLDARKYQKVDPKQVMTRLSSYAQYGEDNPYRDIYEEKELKNKKPESLVFLIKDLLNYKSNFSYYGKDSKKVEKIVSKYFKTKGNFKNTGKLKEYKIKDAKGVIYFVNKSDMSQVHISELAKGMDKFDLDKSIYSNIFNSYFGSGLSSVVFQEIRESRSLAYSSYAVFSSPNEKDEYFTLKTFVGTQPDKLLTANEVMDELLADMPKYDKSFNSAKNKLLKNIAGMRVNERGLFSYKRRLEDKGLKNSSVIYSYNKIKGMDINSIYKFFNENIKPLKRDIVLLGDKSRIDLDKLSKDTGKKVVELEIDYIFNY